MFLCLWLACVGEASRPSLPPPPPPPPEAPPPPSPEEVLSALSGRKAWVVNAPPAACAAVEALGLQVECEPERPGAAQKEIVAWCPEISAAALRALRAHLTVPDFSVRSWELQPSERNPDECGQFYEITIRY